MTRTSSPGKSDLRVCMLRFNVVFQASRDWAFAAQANFCLQHDSHSGVSRSRRFCYKFSSLSLAIFL